jgi:hypothetical protein
VTPFGGKHYEIERVHALDLEPGHAALAGFVGRRERLGHHAYVTPSQRIVIETLRLVDVAGYDAGNHQCFRNRLRQRRVALHRRRTGQRPRAETQAIEEENRERQRRLHRRDVERAAETAHRHLEGLRPAVRPQAQRLSIEDQ